MNFKRYIIATLALFAFYFFYGWLVHGKLLTGIYEQTPNLWRTVAEMKANLPLLLVFNLALAAWVTFAFTQLYKEGGVVHGLFFGLLFGVFAAILSASSYIWLPISTDLSFYWFVANLVEGLGAGLIVGALYRR